MAKGKNRSIFMLLLSIPMFGAASLFSAQIIFGRVVNVGLGVIAGVSLLGIVGTALTIKESAVVDDI